MERIYTQADAQHWAEFSGDFNPIHFDTSLSGSSQIMANSVHGMRALLDVKQALANAWPISCGANWFHFNARFLAPLRCGQRNRLSVEQKNARVIGQFVDLNSGTACITARLQGCDVPEWESKEGAVGRLDEPLLREWMQGCPGLDFSGVWQWAFLDAVLFRTLLSSNIINDVLKPLYPALSAGSLTELFKRVVVVQTHHETGFHRRILPMTSFQNIGWRILPALLITGDAHNGVVCQLTIVGSDEVGPLMSSVVTLKTLPEKDLINNHKESTNEE